MSRSRISASPRAESRRDYRSHARGLHALARPMLRLLVLVAILQTARAGVRNGALELTPDQVRAGASIDLNGDWSYQPGYAVGPNDQPAAAIPATVFKVPVPQLLNRIHWWLDDSQDFARAETNRLKRLGFDTERAVDGWYYLRLKMPSLPPDRHVFVEFEGIAMISRVYCNGRQVGEHRGMFSRFDCDLTQSLHAGDNLLAIFVSMEKIPPSTLSMGEAVTVNLTASKVMTMSKGMFGPLSPGFDNRAYDLHGIWQPVKLAVRGAARLDDVWFEPSLDGAQVHVLARSLAGPRKATLSARWSDLASGKIFAELPPELCELGTEPVARTLSLSHVQPKLWTPANPNLYRLEVSLQEAPTSARSENKTRVLDAWSHNVGFRTFQARGNQFYLNGKPWWLRGANHLPYGKNPFNPALPKTLIRLLHDSNIRITRTHATPWNETWLSAADEIGLAVSLEGIRPWALAGKIGATPPALFAHWLMENEDVVKRARNHPSVFLYTIGNEMLLRDPRNLEKWRQLSDVVKQTRKLDPSRPIICSSDYLREPELFHELLQPNSIDDGDADDLHRYNNWYGPSSFVVDARFEKEANINGGTRPLIGQEMSSGYPDLDTGLPVLRYTRDLLTPQAWVGQLAYPGNDPAFFLEHHRAVTKRWAERLRFERGNATAGFMLFAAECWFSHSYDPARVKSYPVVDAIRQAFTPVGLALETGRRRFFSGEELGTAVFVINDDEEGRDLADLRIELLSPGPKRELGQLKRLPYGEVARVPVRLSFPASSKRQRQPLTLRLLMNGREISQTIDPVEIWPPLKAAQLETTLYARGVGPELTRFLETSARFRSRSEPGEAAVLLLGAGNEGLENGGVLRKAIERGATAVLLSPGQELNALFSADLLDVKRAPGEFADLAPCAGTKLTQGLGPIDLKWWGRKGDERVFVADSSHRLRAEGRARELIRYIPPHSYISEDKKAEQYRVVLAEIPVGRGRLWICDLDLEASVAVDPAARQFALNLLRAAADAESTAKLPRSDPQLLRREL